MISIAQFPSRSLTKFARLTAATALLAVTCTSLSAQTLELNDREYFTKRGLDVLVFSNWYDGNFSDSKIAGIELIHHGVRTATNGDGRLSRTRAQWDTVPPLQNRSVLPDPYAIEARLASPDRGFACAVRAEPRASGVVLRVVLDEPLPQALEGKAG